MPRKQSKKVQESEDVTETGTEFVSESESGAQKVPKKRGRKQKASKKATYTTETETDIKHETEITETAEEYDGHDTTSQALDESETQNEVKGERQFEQEEEGDTAEPQDVDPSDSGDTCSKIKPQDMDLSDEEENDENPVKVDDIVDGIIHKMSNCADKDIELMKKSQPAYHKLMYSKKLLKKLKNLKVQRKFLENGGLEVLSIWLDKTTDGSYPCLTVIEVILEIIDYLPIEAEHLTECKLGKIVKRLEKK